MVMVALNSARTKVVPAESLEARWMVQDGEVNEFMKQAKKHPRMQELMVDQEKARIEDEKKSADRAKLEATRVAKRVEAGV